MKKVIITGATGFLGINLVNELLSRGCEVTAIVRRDSSKLSNLFEYSNLSIILADINDIDRIKNETLYRRYDAFYHLAWGGIRASERDDEQLQNSNYKLTLSAVNLATELGCHTFVGTGSQAEYGPCIGKITEDYPPNPNTEYGKAKLRACYDAMKIVVKNRMNFIWTRIFSLYGNNDYSETLVMSSLRKMLDNQPVPLTECIQKWDFLHVRDAAIALTMLGENKNAFGVYNIASGVSKPLREFVLQMWIITNSESQLNFGAIPNKAGGAVSFEPVIEKIKQDISWKPSIEFNDGIKEIIENMRKGNKKHEDH